MYHELGETSYLVRGLVVAIRPSIAWRLGIPVPPLDNLTQDGSLGWHLGLRSVLRRHRKHPDATPESVIGWLSEQALDQQRRQIPLVDIVEALRWSIPALEDQLVAMDTAEFVDCWQANLADSARPRAKSVGASHLSPLVDDTIRALRVYEGTEALATTLYGYVDTTLETTRTQLSSDQFRPRLHPPLEHRQDWLDVLVELHCTGNSIEQSGLTTTARN